MKNILKTTLAMFLTGVLATSCDSYKDTDTPDSFVEPDKNLSGVWQLSKVKRNNIDITSSMDFSQFRLYLNSDYRYELENRLPFPVETDGTWDVDDITHPFQLTFCEDDAAIGVDVAIQCPIVKGQRQLAITHSPGCESNKYEYIFVKAN